MRLIFGRRITDEATCYKAFRTDLLKRLDLKCNRFEFCPEVTAKLCRLGIPIEETPIRYQARSAAEGKKIGWRDAVQAFWTLIWWRFAPVKLLESLTPTLHGGDSVAEGNGREIERINGDGAEGHPAFTFKPCSLGSR